DFHQFPPVVGAKRSALFCEPHASDTLDTRLGRQIYEEFRTVVLLQEQMRVTDVVWREFLSRLRNGKVSENDVEMLHDLTLKETDNLAELQSDLWKGAALVTPQHGVRSLWNREAVRRSCSERRTPLYVINAEDSIGGRPLTMPERIEVAKRGAGERTRQRQNLPHQIELGVGMKVMVTSNVKTDLDVANGARGEIVDIILDPRETPVPDSAEIVLQYIPKYVLVKMDRTR
ncbi:hypothetical protein FB446DRAFT_627269, partial [Lentinula raphanica]